MDHQREPPGPKQEELPQMDGSCDACEPDEAQPATHVCYSCSFAFCPVHADSHTRRTRHLLLVYNHEAAQACSLAVNGDSVVEDGQDLDEVRNRELEQVGVALADEDENVAGGEAQNGLLLEAQLGARAEGGEAVAQEGVVPPEPGKRDTVTVERLRCKEHGQEASLYCKPDEKIICVVCAVQGEHREHEIITLHEAYQWQKNRQGYDLLGCTQQMAEKIKTKWTNPEMSTEELEDYVNEQFDELRRLVRLEEKRTLHLVDLKEAFLTASAAEKIAEITVQTERLQEEMANITEQLCLLEQAEAQAVGAAVVAEILTRSPAPANRIPHDIDARPRIPEPRADPMDPLDLGDNESGPSMDHAP
ncbi:tripartite motif-containing protein 44 isoform X2 [Thalassophryne amazonica]|uniref:tripartite motif-containing protein 44 isoform X2 n=1 Tax=Thalassophryne amazonica TaxID=390379 RepID=UPI0014719A51|nr:tripartite motif-containing protein 44 isoform X2 [Thalassophryne amazonica]